MSNESQFVDHKISSPRNESARIRILIVDDNPEVAECLALLLETLGHETSMANSGADAIEMAHRVLPDTMLIDIGMPQINGYELARRLRADPKLTKIRLVALSGYGQDEDRRRAYDAGFDAHLTKPASSDALESVLVNSGTAPDRRDCEKKTLAN